MITQADSMRGIVRSAYQHGLKDGAKQGALDALGALRAVVAGQPDGMVWTRQALSNALDAMIGAIQEEQARVQQLESMVPETEVTQ